MPFDKKKYLLLFVPFLAVLLFLFCESAFFTVSGAKMPFISLIICFVFYFTVFNPKKMNVFFVFLLGFFADFFMMYPLGFHAICLTLTSFVAGFFRRTISHLSFNGQWSVFLALFLGVLILMALLSNLVLSRSLLFSDFLFNLIVMVLCYPFIARMAAFVNLKIGDGR